MTASKSSAQTVLLSAVRGSKGHICGTVNRGREDVSVVVVDMLAQEIDTARRTCNAGAGSPERLAKCRRDAGL